MAPISVPRRLRVYRTDAKQSLIKTRNPKLEIRNKPKT